MSETIGQKLTNYPYSRYLENKSRVTIKGNRYRLGNINHPYNSIYKSQGMSAAFEAMGLTVLENIKTTIDNLFSEVKEGEVYVMTNPSFGGWLKIGMAINSKDRVNQFQTGSPHRNYKLVKSYKVSDKREAELEIHNLLEEKFRRKGEWFKCSYEEVETLLENHFKVRSAQLELF